MIKVLTVIGTRPEIIKLSKIIKLLDDNLDHVLVHTGQNYDYELINFEIICLNPIIFINRYIFSREIIREILTKQKKF